MIIRLFFIAWALLLPCVAFGGDPSAYLPVQVVPAGTTTSTQCPSVAPAEAQRAGFTTMVFCQDFRSGLSDHFGVNGGLGRYLLKNWTPSKATPAAKVAARSTHFISR